MPGKICFYTHPVEDEIKSASSCKHLLR